MTRIEAEGQARAIFAKLDAEARGQFEILAKKGEGFQRIVAACGGAQQAFQMLMLEHLDHLAETAAKAISNLKFDKVIVWDGGGADGKGGGTANFVRSLAGALPPALQIMRDVGGVQMPEYFGSLVGDPGARAQGASAAPAVGTSPASGPTATATATAPPPPPTPPKGGGEGPKPDGPPVERIR